MGWRLGMMLAVEGKQPCDGLNFSSWLYELALGV